MQKALALLLMAACLLAQGLAAAEETTPEEITPEEITTEEITQDETARYVFDCDIDTFNERFQRIFNAMDNTYEMGEEPNIENAYEYHLPANVYAKVLTYEGKIEYILLFLSTDYSENQAYLWQFGAIMAASVGDMPASTWAEILMMASRLELDTQEASITGYVGGDLMMICQTDPDASLLYVILEREEYERNEPMDGSFQTGNRLPVKDLRL